jgi:phosphoserine phosphatase
MDTLIAFDFDGTLYPFAPYDSEELLMLLASRSRGELIRARAKRAVAKDMAGKSSLEVFDRDYLRYAKGATMQTIRE